MLGGLLLGLGAGLAVGIVLAVKLPTGKRLRYVFVAFGLLLAEVLLLGVLRAASY